MSNPKLLNILLLILFASTTVYAQHTATFELSMPETKIAGSLYNKLTVIDARPDTMDMGIVQTGALNRRAKVVSVAPVPVLLTKMFSLLIDSAARNNEMLIQLRQLSFAEITGAMSEKGYCYLRADAYAKEGQTYQKIRSVDTVVLVKAMDVTRPLFKRASKIINDFIAGGLIIQPVGGQTYSYQDVINIENIEKQGMKLYTSETYTDGVYLTYQSFMNQVPDKLNPEVEFDEAGNPVKVKVADATGKMEKLKPQNFYAIVIRGKPFVASHHGIYALKKVNNDFIFIGKADVTAKTGDIVAASLFFGVTGALIATNAEAVFEMKLDHINGGFMRLREVEAVGM